jgi:hypothetical protein
MKESRAEIVYSGKEQREVMHSTRIRKGPLDMKRLTLVLSSLVLLPVVALLIGAAPGEPLADAALREKAEKIMRDGNYKEAFDLYQKLVLNPADNPVLVGNDLHGAIACLNQINRTAENDSFREKAVNVHSNNWKLLYDAARSYFDEQHYGTIIAGEFQRGPNRGGDGKWGNSFERDRIRALQLMVRAMEKGEMQIKAEADQLGSVTDVEVADRRKPPSTTKACSTRSRPTRRKPLKPTSSSSRRSRPPGIWRAPWR